MLDQCNSVTSHKPKLKIKILPLLLRIVITSRILEIVYNSTIQISVLSSGHNNFVSPLYVLHAPLPVCNLHGFYQFPLQSL